MQNNEFLFRPDPNNDNAWMWHIVKFSFRISNFLNKNENKTFSTARKMKRKF